MFDAWRRTHAQDADGKAGLLASHFGKLPGLLLRLALILEHLWWSARGGDAPSQVTLAAIEAARTLVESYWKSMAERTFGDAALPDYERKAGTLAKWILRTRPRIVNARELRREVRLPGLRTAPDATAAITVLMELGWLRTFGGKESGTAGRPRSDYEVNPALFANRGSRGRKGS